MYDFLTDLDEYFCEKYANYDKLCILPGYKMPLMQASTVDDFGRTRTYTLPADTMRLALQEKKTELLALVKEKITDTTFSFSFEPLKFFKRIRNKTSQYGFHKNFKLILNKYNLTAEKVGEDLDIAPAIWKGICKGNFLPTKNTLFSVALTAHISLEDTLSLFALCEYELDYAVPKDVVLSYLLSNKVYNRNMIDAALAEYKVINLFIK